MSSDLKKTRTVRLDPSIDNRLVELCDHIGTNPNAYLTAEIGKAISRDELSLKTTQSAFAFQDGLKVLLEGVLRDLAKGA